MKTPRITRPRLERTSPMRMWSTLFGAGTPSSDNGSDAATRATEAVQRGVEMAYRVSDEYIRQGQAFARTLSQPFSSLVSTGSHPKGEQTALPQLTERMFRYTTELSSMWMEAVRMMSNNVGVNGHAAPRQEPTSPRMNAPQKDLGRGTRANGASHNGRAPKVGRETLAIEVESRRATRAKVELHREIKGEISVSPLKNREGAGTLSRVRIERDDGLVVVVRVPPRQAAGTYVGSILEAGTSELVGTITVRVSR
jgi:hypothetical protein